MSSRFRGLRALTMNLSNAIIIGLKEIWAHKFRSVLTMLGIILGVSSLVGMSAIVKGMENGMKEALIALGGLDKVLVDDQDVPSYQSHRSDEAPGRTIHDVYALKQSAPLLRLISPEMRTRNMVLTRAGKMVIPAELVGVWPVVPDDQPDVTRRDPLRRRDVEVALGDPEGRRATCRRLRR